MSTALTSKQWQRRALKAEAELETIHRLHAFNAKSELQLARENAALRVALREIQEVTNWAYGSIAETLGGEG